MNKTIAQDWRRCVWRGKFDENREHFIKSPANVNIFLFRKYAKKFESTQSFALQVQLRKEIKRLKTTFEKTKLLEFLIMVKKTNDRKVNGIRNVARATLRW